MKSSQHLRVVLGVATASLAAAVALPGTASAQAAAPYKDLPSGTKTTKTLVIGLDGATFSTFARAGVPHLQGLMAEGLTSTSNLYANPMAPTVSGAGWSTIATGVWPDKHNVVDNNFGTRTTSSTRTT